MIWELIIPLGRTDRRPYHVELQQDRGDDGTEDVRVDTFLERAWARREAAGNADEKPKSKPIDGCP